MNAYHLVILILGCLASTSQAQLPTIIPTGNPLINITYTLIGGTVNFVINAKTRGYVGFGISNNTCMTGSDALVTWMDWSTNEVIVQDWTFLTTGTPYEKHLDESQDWFVDSLSWDDDGESSTIRFHRLLNTGDPEDIVIEDRTQNLIFVVGEFPALHAHQIGRSGNINFNLIRGVPWYRPEQGFYQHFFY